MTAIEWTDETWNPVVGCSVVSPGCTNCYAMREARRLAANPRTPQYKGTVDVVKGKSVWNGQVHFVEGALLKPLKWRKPRRIFVNSMGDLFHEKVPTEWIDRVFAVMALAPQHTFQVLTKRPYWMRAYMKDGRAKFGAEQLGSFEMVRGVMLDHWPELTRSPDHPHGANGMPWPLPNVWLGTSVEDQTRANERIPHLLETPAAVRFLSCEPLLGAVDLDLSDGHEFIDSLRGIRCNEYPAGSSISRGHGKIVWVICGGESGPGARPMHPDWARSLRDQCQAARVPFFFKQWGEWVSVSEVEGEGPHYSFPDGATVRRTGKKTAGRTLDGRAWDQMPGSDDRDQASGINQQTVM